MKEKERIKELINEAEAIVIGAGAGLSSAAGFEYGGKTYYVTKELGDKNLSDLFYRFRQYVNENYKDFYPIFAH